MIIQSFPGRRLFAPLGVLGLLSIAAAAPALAGTSFTSVTRTGTEGKNGRPGTGETKIHGVVDGLGSKVEFLDSANPMMPAGTYGVTKDGGKTLYIVDPKERTYYPLDMEGVLGESMGAMKGMGADIKIENLKVEKLLDEGGPTMLGLPTRHYKFKTSYTMTMKMMGTHTSTQITTEDETWSSPKLSDAAFGLWLRRDPIKTGIEDMDKLMKAEMSKIEGFPLKKITVLTSASGSGKGAAPQTTTTTMEVTEIQTVSPSGSMFEVPAGYQKTKFDMMKVMMRMKAGQQHEKREK